MFMKKKDVFDFGKEEIEKAIEVLSNPSSHSKILVVDEENTICYDSAFVRAMEIAIKTMEKVKKTM